MHLIIWYGGRTGSYWIASPTGLTEVPDAQTLARLLPRSSNSGDSVGQARWWPPQPGTATTVSQASASGCGGDQIGFFVQPDPLVLGGHRETEPGVSGATLPSPPPVGGLQLGEQLP